MSIEDIDEVLEKLATDGISGTETDEPAIGEASSSAAQAEDDDSVPEEMELDLSAGELDKTSDPVRVYMREMGVVPLLKREQEVSIAKRIEWGQKRAQKGITRSPMAIAERCCSQKTGAISPWGGRRGGIASTLVLVEAKTIDWLSRRIPNAGKQNKSDKNPNAEIRTEHNPGGWAEIPTSDFGILSDLVIRTSTFYPRLLPRRVSKKCCRVCANDSVVLKRNVSTPAR